MLCDYQRPLTKEEECVRQYNIAKEVIKRIYAESVNHNFNRVQIVLEKNYVCMVDAIGNITYNWARRVRDE